ncbi:MAG: ABC transporter permease [Euryarchaeota archaeon]|nr:ABC transporter permease [Euryarchaeota archaeon]
MPSHLLNIVKKELLEIFRDPRLFIGMVIVPILVFPLMGFTVGTSMEASQKQLEQMEVGVLSYDNNGTLSNYSFVLLAIMRTQNISWRSAPVDTPTDGISWCIANNLTVLVVIPANFSERIDTGESARLEVFQVLVDYGFTESAISSRVVGAVDTFNKAVTASRLHATYPGVPSEELLVPAQVKSQSVVKGEIKDVDPNTLVATISMSSIMMPVVIMILIIMAAQLAATSVAMEKEQKTMEVLLSLPIKRIYILIGKLAGVIVVSLIATLTYIVGFSYYMTSITGGAGVSLDLNALGMSPEPVGYAIMVASLFLSFITALSLAVLLAAYTKDVRSAQSLMGLMYMPLMIPTIVLMFAPLDVLPTSLQAVLYAIPFTYPILASHALYTKEYFVVLIGIIYQVAFTAAILWLATRLFASEKVLTAKLEFGRKRKRIVE